MIKRNLSIRHLLIVSFLIPIIILLVIGGRVLMVNLDAASYAGATKAAHEQSEAWCDAEKQILFNLFRGLDLIYTQSASAETALEFAEYHKNNKNLMDELVKRLPTAATTKLSPLTDPEFLKAAIADWHQQNEVIIQKQSADAEALIQSVKDLRHAFDDVKLMLYSPVGKESYIQYQELTLHPIIRQLHGLALEELLILNRIVRGEPATAEIKHAIEQIRKQIDAEKTRFQIVSAQLELHPKAYQRDYLPTEALDRLAEVLRLLNQIQQRTTLNPSVEAISQLSPAEWIDAREQVLVAMESIEKAMSEPLESAIYAHQSYTNSMLALTVGGAGIILLSMLKLYINLRQRVLHPIQKLSELMAMMTRNQYPAEPPSYDYKDEIGEMYEMLGRFQGNMEIIEDQKEDIRIAMQKAEESTRMKSEFLASMSHEIRTPLNGVIGTANLLLDTELKHDQRSYAQTVVSSANNLLQLVNDILDLSKIEAGKLELESIPFDLRQTVEEVGDLMAVKAYEKHMELMLRYAPNAPRYVVGDPSRIRQIFLNLCNNALKFTEAGHVVISVEVKEATTDTAHFYISIEDTGIGIPEDKLNTIFEKFSQADGSMSRKYGGTGLGLTICQQLISLMNGEIGVKSTVGVGSTFWVSAELKLDKSSIAPAPDLGLKDLRVLVVDDNRKAQTIEAEILESHGLHVDVASGAIAGYEKMAAAAKEGKPYQFAVIDYIMPEVDGIDLARMIERDTSLANMVLVMTTSSPNRGDDQRVQSLGFEGYLTKHAAGLYLPAALARIWKARQMDQAITLVTQFNLRERKDRRKTGEPEEIRYDGVWVLLVEDNPVNQMVANKTLGKYGLHVITANDGAEAVEQFKSREFHLVFMDCQMPVMDGFDATRNIRQHEESTQAKRTPIIAFTANTMKGDEEKCRDSGMDDFISKPFQPDDLKSKLVKWLGEPDSAQDASSAA